MSKEKEKGREGEKEDGGRRRMRGTIQGEWRRKVIEGGVRRKDEGERRSRNRNEEERKKEESKGVEEKQG